MITNRHSREQKMNGKEFTRCWQPKSWCNYLSRKHTWEIRTNWMQEWRSCVCERERGWHCVLSALINTESRAPETACLRKRLCVVCPFLIGLCDNILVTQRPWRTTVFHALTSTDNKTMMNSWIREFPQDQMNSDFLHIEHRAQRKCVCVVHLLVHLCTDWMNMNATGLDNTVLNTAGSFLFTDFIFLHRFCSMFFNQLVSWWFLVDVWSQCFSLKPNKLIFVKCFVYYYILFIISTWFSAL